MTQIDDYELIGKLGEGGMGAVYKARQVSLDRVVALKVLAPKLATNPEYVTRFLREARATAKLNHPHIVAGIGVGSAAGYHFFAMEFVEGENFKRHVESKSRMSEAEVLRIGVAIGSALAHAHAMGIVHRDVKPDNILIARDGTPKLADLGLAKAVVAEDSSLTQSGMAVGTPHYIAPEQANGEPDIDGRADLYALGCTLYHAATGSTPFTANTSAAIMVKHLNDRMAHPQSLRADLSNEFCLILSRMVARDRDDRYATLEAAVADMEGLLAGEQPSCRPLPAARSRFVESTRATGGSSTMRRERGETRRQVPVGSDDGHSGSRESRRRIAAQKPGHPWLWPGVAAGTLVLLGGLGYLVSGSGKAVPEKTLSVISNPEPAQAPVAVRPSTPATSTASAVLAPVASMSEKAPALPSLPLPAVAPAAVAEVRPPSPSPAPSSPVAPKTAELPPTSAETTAVFDGKLEGWKLMQPVWTVEDGALVGRGTANNVAIWKFGALLMDFDFTFDAESTQEFHFGFTGGHVATIYIHHDEGAVRITRYNEENTELARASLSLPYGKHAWRVVAHNGTVKVCVDGTSAVEARNVDLLPAGAKTDLCFFASPHSTLRLKNLLVRAPSDAVATPSPAPTPETAQKPAELSADAKTQAEAQAAYAAFADDYLALMRKLDAKGAADLAGHAAKMPVLAPLSGLVKQDQALLELLNTLLAAEADGARKLTDVDDFELAMGHGAPQHVGRKTPLHVAKVEKGAIVLDGGGVTLQTNLAQLSPDTRFKLIAMGLPAVPASASHAFLDLLMLKNSGDAKGLAAIRTQLDAARKSASSSAHPDVDAVERWAQLVEDGAQNAAAAATWPRLNAQAEQQQGPALKSALAEFARNYDKTRFYQSHRAEIDALNRGAQDAADSALPPDEQLKRLSEKLKAANPDFDGAITPTIQNGKITGLQLSAKGLKDLAPLRGITGLQSLALTPVREGSVLTDVSPLKGLQLTHLEMSYSKVADLTPLRGMPLVVLDIGATPVADLTPLKGMPLESLNAQCTQVADFSPLQGAPLRQLQCFGCTKLADLKSLQGLPLETLNCSWNRITDVTPLQNMPLKYLNLEEIKTDDLAPLKNLKLITLKFSYKPGVYDALLRDWTALEYINALPAADFRAKAANGTLTGN